MEFVRLEYDNNKATNAELNGHQEVIKEYVEKGYKYLGELLVLIICGLAGGSIQFVL